MNAAPEAACGVYVHLPFCAYLCPYCDFAKWPLRASAADRYLDALAAEIATTPARRASTLFLGGGTPNALPAAAISRVVGAVRARFALPADAETTIEANPDARLCTDLAAYRDAGITRLSLGVQSFDAAELATLGRRHDGADVAAIVRRARAEGFGRVSLDLIFGTPGQTLATWRATLRAAIALAPDHVSTYGLTVEDGTPYADWFAREPAAFASDGLEADLYALAIELLEAAGYEHYEISNFARPGARCAHNENYWRNGEYVGLGVGAASYVAGERSVATRDLARYGDAALAGAAIPRERERLGGRARAGEALMLALRTADGVDLAAFARRYGLRVSETYARELARLRADGLIDLDDARLRLTRRGRFLANEACAAFIEVPA